MKNKLFILSLVAMVTGAMFSCNCSKPGNETPKKIAVTGSAEMEVVPDEIYMTFTLKEYLDASKQKVKLDDVKAAFLTNCTSVGIPDSSIVISGYSGNERWDFYNYRRRRTEPDFMASIAYTIKVNSPEKLDQLVAMVNDQALDNFYISKTTHSKMEELRKEVKMNALKASKSKADYLAKSIGEEIGKALLIHEIENNMYSDVTENNNYMLKSNMAIDQSLAGGAPDFQKIKIRYEMICEFELK